MTNELAVPAGAMDFRDFDQRTPMVLDAGGLPVVVTVESAMRLLCPNAPPVEVLGFLLTCKHGGLNPWLKEAYLLPPFGNKTTRWTLVISKSGYLKHAMKSPSYDGHRSGVVILFNGKRHEVEGTILPPTATLLGGWCEVYRKGVSRPLKRVVSLEEYDTQQNLWKTKTCTMIEKVAFVAAFRDAFGLGGYDPAELGKGDDEREAVRPPLPPLEFETLRPYPAGPDPATLREQTKALPELVVTGRSTTFVLPDVASAPPKAVTLEIAECLIGLHADEDDVRAILSSRGVETIDDLSERQADDLLAKLRSRLGFEDVVAAITDSIQAAPSAAEEPEQPPVTVPAETVTLPDVARRHGPEENTASVEPHDLTTELTDEQRDIT